jgi:hypothetical protein
VMRTLFGTLRVDSPRWWHCGCQPQLPRPDLPLIVGLDGGSVHSSAQTSRRDGWFEVIAGKSMPTEGLATCFGSVQTYDKKPQRRLYEIPTSQGMQANQQVTFLTDGGEDIPDAMTCRFTSTRRPSTCLTGSL